MIQPAGAGLRIPHKAKPSCVGRLLLQARGYRHKSSTWAPHPGGSHLGVFLFPNICVSRIHASTCWRKPADHGPGPGLLCWCKPADPDPGPSLLPQARACSHKSSTCAPHPGGSHLGVFLFQNICASHTHDSTCWCSPADSPQGKTKLPRPPAVAGPRLQAQIFYVTTPPRREPPGSFSVSEHMCFSHS